MAVTRRKDPKTGRVLPEGVYYRKAEDRYMYKYNLYGKTKYIYDKDLTSIKEKIKQHMLDVASGRNTDLASMSLNKWYPQYIKIFKEPKVKSTTLFNLKNYYDWYVEPYAIGRMPMRELKRSHIVAHFQYLATDKELSHGTLRSLASMLYNCLEQVVGDGALFVNPAAKIMKDVVAKPPETRDALTDEEVKTLIEFLKEEGFQNIYLPIIGVILGTGLRWGEVSALTWDDIDYERKLVHITKSMNYRCKNSAKHEFFISTPKTENAIRDIPLSEDLLELFRIQKKYQNDLRIRQDIIIDGHKGFVFTTKLGMPLTNEAFRATLRRIIKQLNQWEKERAEKEDRRAILLNEKITGHYLRHTFITNLVLSDVPELTTMSICGHAKYETTINIYTHIREEKEKQMRTDIGNVVKIF